jgi:hypothetical protein
VNAHYIKGHANWGGGVEDVYFRNNRVLTCESLLCLQPDSGDEAGTMGVPYFSNINMQSVTCEDATEAAFFLQGDPRLRIHCVNLSNITIQNVDRVAVISNTIYLDASGIVANGVPVQVL